MNCWLIGLLRPQVATSSSFSSDLRDRPRDRDREIFPFEENAGVAVRPRTQTISRCSNVVFFIFVEFRHHDFRTQTFFFSLEPGRPKKGEEFLGCHLVI